MNKTITILAVSKLGNELCVAGVDENDNWIRPTSLSGGWRQFYKVDIYDKNNRPIIALSNVVAIRLIRHIPQIGTPHIEDWEYDFLSCKPVFKKNLNDSQRVHLFQKSSEQSLDSLIENHERSLCLIEPTSIVSANFANISYRGKYQPILDFTFKDKLYSYKVTDINWRAFGRYLSTKGHKRVLNGKKLQDILQYSSLFLAIGLTRLYKGEYWPMVVGVHTVPQFPLKIDYENI